MKPQNHQAIQDAIDDEYATGASKPLQFLIPFEDGNPIAFSPNVPAPVVVPPPIPPASWPKIKHQQKSGEWYKDVGGNADLLTEDVLINQGGGVRFVSSGRCTIRRFASDGAPSGKGMYAAIVATGGCKEFLWDNTGLVAQWIFHGNEAALRIMGGCDKATVTNVDFCGRMHLTTDKGVDDPKSTKLLALPKLDAERFLIQPAKLDDPHVDWWKQAVQWRHVKDAKWLGGRCVGRWDVGKQAAPNDPQRVEKLWVEGVGLTDEPHFTDPKSFGVVTRKDCYLIDLTGRPVKKGGQLVKWPDKTWKGH